jgi:hypothetical protein
MNKREKVKLIRENYKGLNENITYYIKLIDACRSLDKDIIEIRHYENTLCNLEGQREQLRKICIIILGYEYFMDKVVYKNDN